ncbi:MAG: hypothetical protein Q4C87_04990 [Actinomycetaceae bacterium]|nr:hypothetical protein [Actinomycetaceae bacterium]
MATEVFILGALYSRRPLSEVNPALVDGARELTMTRILCADGESEE